jgi:hypothetical protein
MGVILHGSRSGASHSIHNEFVGTADYAVNEPGGLGWNATIGADEIAVHMRLSQWGWNARAASSRFFGVEFAQASVNDPIVDGQVRAFCWFVQQARALWPNLPLYFPTHAELDGTPIYGGYHDGKTDVFPKNDPRTEDLRHRIAVRLNDLGVK